MPRRSSRTNRKWGKCYRCLETPSVTDVLVQNCYRCLRSITFLKCEVQPGQVLDRGCRNQSLLPVPGNREPASDARSLPLGWLSACLRVCSPCCFWLPRCSCGSAPRPSSAVHALGAHVVPTTDLASSFLPFHVAVHHGVFRNVADTKSFARRGIQVRTVGLGEVPSLSPARLVV